MLQVNDLTVKIMRIVGVLLIPIIILVIYLMTTDKVDIAVKVIWGTVLVQLLILAICNLIKN
jgi:hypothetical protein